MKQLPVNWQIKETAQDVAEKVRDKILLLAKKAIDKRGCFKIVLAGGSTPKQIYKLLAKESCDWQNWQIYLGDERCLDVHDSARNSQMIQQTFLDKVAIPKVNIHMIPTELGAEQAARRYQKLITEALPFDVVLLGMGEDGHTASLFPEHQHASNELVHVILNAPKPPSERVSLSVKALNQNLNLIIIITGESKQSAVQQWRKGKDLPVSRINSLFETTIFLDKSAFS